MYILQAYLIIINVVFCILVNRLLLASIFLIRMYAMFLMYEKDMALALGLRLLYYLKNRKTYI